MAEIIAADISLHMQNLETTIMQIEEDQNVVPRRNRFPLLLYTSVVGRVGELPASIVGDLVLLYRLLAKIDEIAQDCRDARDALNAARGDDDVRRCAREIVDRLETYRRMLYNVRDRINRLQPTLIQLSRPKWSLRFWRVPEATDLDVQAHREKAQHVRAEHHARIEQRMRRPPD